MDNDALKRLSLLMTVTCVRNTIIEDYHTAGKLNDAEMKAFNKAVANKLFTFVHYLFNATKADRKRFLERCEINYPHSWDEPDFDKDLSL